MSVFHRILLAFDGSFDSVAALELASALASDQGARLTLLSVVPEVPLTTARVTVGPYDLESNYQALQREALQRIPEEVSLTMILRHGNPAHHIAEAAKDHDLLVMGTHGRGRIGEALAGSVSRAVMHTWRGAVLLCRAPGSPAEETKDE